MSVNPAGDKLAVILSDPDRLPDWYKELFIVVISTLDGLNETDEFKYKMGSNTWGAHYVRN